MAFRRLSTLLVVLVVLNNIFGGFSVDFQHSLLHDQVGGDIYVNLGEHYNDMLEDLQNPEALEEGNHDLVKRRSSNECTYTVNFRSKIFSNEEITMCAGPRHSLPCRISPAADCVVPPMEVSNYDLMYLLMFNQELMARIMILHNQDESDMRFGLELRKEVELMISDTVAWLCARKCNNSTCEFNAELQPNVGSLGGMLGMTSLITDYPRFIFKSRPLRIKIDLPIGSFEISRLLKKKAPFRHLAVPNLPLTVTCLKN